MFTNKWRGNNKKVMEFKGYTRICEKTIKNGKRNYKAGGNKWRSL